MNATSAQKILSFTGTQIEAKKKENIFLQARKNVILIIRFKIYVSEKYDTLNTMNTENKLNVLINTSNSTREALRYDFKGFA